MTDLSHPHAGCSAAGAVELSARRGVRTVLLPRARRVVKSAVATDDGAAADHEGVRREAHVLATVPHLRVRFEPELRALGGSTALVERALDGGPAFDGAAAAVAAGRAAAVLATLRATLADLAVLHAAGWAHGDLQPRHVITTPDGVALLDHGLAQRCGEPLPGHRGGMVHFVAPELAAAVRGHGAGTATPAADVFALAGSVVVAVTGHPPGDYGPAERWEVKLAALAAGRLALGRLHTALREAPALRDVLLAMLEPDPDRRPGDAAAALTLC